MLSSIDLKEAAQALAAYYGPRVTASRQGGRQQFAAFLSRRFDLAEADAARTVAALEQRQALRWVSAHTTLQPCPGMLELSGTWRIQPPRLAGQATG